MKTDKTNSHYQKWYESEEGKNHRLNILKKSGIPLELRARKILKENAFDVSNAYYLEFPNEIPDNLIASEQNKLQEIDLLASKNENNIISINGCNIKFTTSIIGECKYSTEHDIFVFEHLKPSSADLSHFSIPVNGQEMLPLPLARYFNFPLLVERLTEIKSDGVSKANFSKKGGNLDDRITYAACRQITSALRFYIHTGRILARQYYNSISKTSKISGIWQGLIRAGKVQYQGTPYYKEVPDSFITEFLKNNFIPERMLQDFYDITVNIFFPIIIIDSSRGIIRVKLNESYDVVDLEDIGSCTYAYVPSDRYNLTALLDKSIMLPIIICNLTHLDEIIKMVSEGINKIVDKTREELLAKPYLIPKEVLFNRKIVL